MCMYITYSNFKNKHLKVSITFSGLNTSLETGTHLVRNHGSRGMETYLREKLNTRGIREQVRIPPDGKFTQLKFQYTQCSTEV